MQTMSNFYAKKSLGQNFLKSPGIFLKIARSAKISPEDVVLEIGPGQGGLTEQLLKFGKKVIAVEKDHRLIPILQEKFSKEIKSNKLVLIEADILNFQPTTYNLQPNNYLLVANIPYYITGAIFKKFLELGPQPKTIVLLTQKEVAERIIARDEKESILSISVKVYGKPHIAGIVPRGAFTPTPKVDSAILVIENISKKLFIKNKVDEKTFFKILKTGFAHKRKKLSGNLKKIVKKEAFDAHKISLDARAEDLTVSDWFGLASPN